MKNLSATDPSSVLDGVLVVAEGIRKGLLFVRENARSLLAMLCIVRTRQAFFLPWTTVP